MNGPSCHPGFTCFFFFGFKICSPSLSGLKELFVGPLEAEGCSVCSDFPTTSCFWMAWPTVSIAPVSQPHTATWGTPNAKFFFSQGKPLSREPIILLGGSQVEGWCWEFWGVCFTCLTCLLSTPVWDHPADTALSHPISQLQLTMPCISSAQVRTGWKQGWTSCALCSTFCFILPLFAMSYGFRAVETPLISGFMAWRWGSTGAEIG